ncbi:hypothetical protein [Qipengyuania sp.]|uniref:hypothetical protein n=1 Tax=Qipengyuania sp. TaxID=2004515 RepID=UPI0035C811D4
MSEPSDHQWDKVYAAIGKVVCEWAELENDLVRLLHDATIAEAPAFRSDARTHMAFLALVENLDIRATVAAIKAIHFHLTYDFDFVAPIGPCLNRIENELRNERNRIVHDSWRLYQSGKLRRLQRGTKLVRQKGSGAELLYMGQSSEFESYRDIEAVAFRIQSEREILKAFREELLRLPPIKPDEE